MPQKLTLADIKALKDTQKQLNVIKTGSKGYANLARLRRYGLIKEHTLKKGKMVEGQIQGKRTKWVLTEKGKQMNRAISQL